MAFLIQPVGYTPQREFAALPNEPIGQILIDTSPGGAINLPTNWYEEKPNTTISQQQLRFIAKTRCNPPLDVSEHRYVWKGYWWGVLNNELDWHLQLNHSETGGDTVDFDLPANMEGSWRIELEILDETAGEERVSGDIIHLDWE
jgi:hypothetical protein